MREKIGIMGGTFNPIHNGHLIMAEAAREYLNLNKVLFMPSGNSYMKDTSSILAGPKRAHMIALAIEGNPYFALSCMELERKGPTYTCDTLEELKRKHPEIDYYFILGADSLLALKNWKNPASILRNCVIAVALRGSGLEEGVKKAARCLHEEYQADIRLLPERLIDISSSEIRQRMKEGKSIRYMLPESVFLYIDSNNLYQSV